MALIILNVYINIHKISYFVYFFGTATFNLNPYAVHTIFGLIIENSALIMGFAIFALVDLLIIIYTRDLFQFFQNSRQLKPFTPFLVHYKWGLPALIIYTVVGLIVCISGLLFDNGIIRFLNSRRAILAVVGGLIFGVLVVWLLYLSIRIKTEIITFDKKMSNNKIKTFIKSCTMVQKYMLGIAVSRGLMVCGLLGIASKLSFSSNFILVFSSFLLLNIPLITNTVLTLMLITEITPTNASNKLKLSTKISNNNDHKSEVHSEVKEGKYTDESLHT